MHTEADNSYPYPCQSYTTVQELKYSQQPFPEENLALNLQLHSQVVIAQNSLTTRKMA